jgi:hypothetical protein
MDFTWIDPICIYLEDGFVSLFLFHFKFHALAVSASGLLLHLLDQPLNSSSTLPWNPGPVQHYPSTSTGMTSSARAAALLQALVGIVRLVTT